MTETEQFQRLAMAIEKITGSGPLPDAQWRDLVCVLAAIRGWHDNLDEAVCLAEVRIAMRQTMGKASALSEEGKRI